MHPGDDQTAETEYREQHHQHLNMVSMVGLTVLELPVLLYEARVVKAIINRDWSKSGRRVVMKEGCSEDDGNGVTREEKISTRHSSS